MRRTPEQRRCDRAAGLDRHGRPLPRAAGVNPAALGVNPRAQGTNPTALGVSPRQLGTNPRALGVSPRQLDPHGLAGAAVTMRLVLRAVQRGRLTVVDPKAEPSSAISGRLL